MYVCMIESVCLSVCQLVPVEISGSSHAKNTLTVHPNLMQSPMRAPPGTDTTDFIGQVRYLPQNPISEMCEVIQLKK